VSALDILVVSERNRFGFMAGQLEVPDDFDQMGDEVIAQLFDAA